MKALIYLGFLAIATAQVCPPANLLAPCGCRERQRELSCYSLERDFNLKGHFDNVSSYVGENVVFQSLSISATQLEEIEEGAVEHLKFKWLFIQYNPELRYISPRAFGASRNVTTDLGIAENKKLVDDDSTFEFIRSMQSVGLMELARNGISSIPSNAFQNMTSLVRLYIVDNNISSIGSQAFSNIPELDVLLIREKSIPSEGLNQNAFDGISSLAEVRLNNSGVTFLEQNSYQPLLDQAGEVHLGDYDESQRFHCDERADWICEGKDRYLNKLYGFNCMANEHSYEDIWGYCAGRNASAYRIY